MDLATRLKQTEMYLKRYLAKFAENGQVSDINWVREDGIVLPQPMPPFYGSFQDFHQTWFKAIYDTLPSATLRDFIEPVAALDSPIVIDIGGTYGAEFSLWVANQNPSCEVKIFNPEIYTPFPEYLFNSLSTENVFKLNIKTKQDPRNIERSVNKLFDTNGFQNVRFFKQSIGEENLRDLIESANGRKVLLYSRRTTTPLVPMLAETAGKYDNVEVLFAPIFFTNAFTRDDSDPVMSLISDYHGIGRNQDQGQIAHFQDSARARLCAAMNQYVWLKAAIDSGADLYKEKHPQKGFPFHHPTHYISTIAPEK